MLIVLYVQAAEKKTSLQGRRQSGEGGWGAMANGGACPQTSLESSGIYKATYIDWFSKIVTLQQCMCHAANKIKVGVPII